MIRSLPIVLSILGIAFAGGAQAKSLKTTGKELFCKDRSNFPEYLAVLHSNQFNYHTVAGCRQVAKGTRYEVLEDNVETGMDKIRLFVWPRPTDGYMLVEGQ
jgi:hypothetical protein